MIGRPQFTTLRHGHSRRSGHSATYGSWANMLSRCNNPNTANYSDYGGRGITVCKAWHSFDNFLRDMGEAPPGTSIDRKNNDRGYSKSNCRWATRAQQNRNRRCNRMITHRGRTLCLRDWERRLGLGVSTLLYHLRRGGTMADAHKIKPRPWRQKVPDYDLDGVKL